jgi:hypothetical protein
MKETHKHADAQIVAVCDVDTKRLGAGKQLVDEPYAASTGKPYSGTPDIPIIASCWRPRTSTRS